MRIQQIPNAQGQAKQAELEFYAMTGRQFNFFKDAWRNRCHYACASSMLPNLKRYLKSGTNIQSVC
jgi:hypothetical protein